MSILREWAQISRDRFRFFSTSTSSKTKRIMKMFPTRSTNEHFTTEIFAISSLLLSPTISASAVISNLNNFFFIHILCWFTWINLKWFSQWREIPAWDFYPIVKVQNHVETLFLHFSLFVEWKFFCKIFPRCFTHRFSLSSQFSGEKNIDWSQTTLWERRKMLLTYINYSWEMSAERRVSEELGIFLVYFSCWEFNYPFSIRKISSTYNLDIVG